MGNFLDFVTTAFSERYHTDALVKLWF